MYRNRSGSPEMDLKVPKQIQTSRNKTGRPEIVPAKHQQRTQRHGRHFRNHCLLKHSALPKPRHHPSRGQSCPARASTPSISWPSCPARASTPSKSAAPNRPLSEREPGWPKWLLGPGRDDSVVRHTLNNTLALRASHRSRSREHAARADRLTETKERKGNKFPETNT